MHISSPSSVRHIHCAGQTLEATVTDKASVVERWILLIITIYQTASHPVVVGLDIEWKPNRFRFTYNRTATLQLCVGRQCLIIQLLHLDYIPVLLGDFLMSTQFIFVGKGIEEDLRKLRLDHGLYCKNYSDLLDIAKERCPGRFLSPGLEELAQKVVGLRMTKMKSVCMSNWEARALSDKQIEYACVDAYASYCVGYKLLVNKNFSCAEVRQQSGFFGFFFFLVRVFLYMVGFALVVSILDNLGLGLVGKIE